MFQQFTLHVFVASELLELTNYLLCALAFCHLIAASGTASGREAAVEVAAVLWIRSTGS